MHSPWLTPCDQMEPCLFNYTPFKAGTEVRLISTSRYVASAIELTRSQQAQREGTLATLIQSV